MGLPAEEVDSALRISFCRDTTAEDIDRFADGLLDAIENLARR